MFWKENAEYEIKNIQRVYNHEAEKSNDFIPQKFEFPNIFYTFAKS